MNKIINLKSNVYHTILLVLIVVYIFGFWFRRPNFDEGIIAEWAYWLSKLGYARSVLYTPFGVGLENTIYVYHKLFTWVASLIIMVFGMEIAPLRVFVFLFLLGLIASFYHYSVISIHKDFQRKFFLISVILLLSIALIFKFTFTFRPEIMISALGFLSFLFLYKGNITPQKNYSILGGVFAGLSFLTHLNGIAYLLSGFIILLSIKQFKNLFFYSLAAGVVSILFFADDISFQAITHFLNGLQSSPDIPGDQFMWYSPLLKIIDEHQRFFHSPIEIALTLLFLLSIIFSDKEFRIKNKFLLTYLLILIISLGSVTHGKTAKYLLLYVPFMVLVITQFLFSVRRLSFWRRNIYLFFLGTYFVIQTLYIMKQFYPHHNVKEYGQNILELIPKGSRVMGNDNLVFAGIDNYEIHSKLTFEFIADQQHIEKNLENYLEFAFNHIEEYVVLSKEYTYEKYWKELHSFNLKKGLPVHDFYKVHFVCDEFTILIINHLN